MSGWLVGMIVLAVAFAGLGLQLLSLQMSRFPGDIRRPGPLIHIRRSKPDMVHGTELRRLISVMSYATINDQSALAELQGVLDELDATAAPVPKSSSRSDQRLRTNHIEKTIVELEARFGLTSGLD